MEFKKPNITKLGKASILIMGNVVGGYNDDNSGRRRTRPPYIPPIS